uniref:Prostaglandin E synthase 2 n=1 Tax=Tetraselmis sp. GSL018 TaxID=582737 RepID=A0A061RRA8_9CHLO|mmetsp:Transcript_32813/g.77780  ORF Transcript_32813/g.77780 Transcript_32813/m.77780 type:complete len:347 (+) Transcript_32813:155-1195(+)
MNVSNFLWRRGLTSVLASRSSGSLACTWRCLSSPAADMSCSSPAIQDRPGEKNPFSAFAAGGVFLGAALACSNGSSQLFVHADADAPVTSHSPDSQSGIVLYQYTVCPFCCKTKAVLDYYKVPYRTVEVNPLTKKEIKWSDYKKVPVLVMDGKQYNDSTYITEEIKARFGSVEPSKKTGWLGGVMGGSAPQKEEATEEEMKWRKWVDEWLVRVITTNIYRTWGESVGSFDYITKNSMGWGPVERTAARYVGAVGMYFIAGKMKKKYSIEGDDRAHLYKALDDWVAAVGGSSFMGGDKPELSDLYVFGVLKAIEGTETFKDAMANTRIQDWFVRMADAVGESSRVES